MSKRKKSIDPKKDYMNMSLPFWSFKMPESKKEEKLYERRLAIENANYNPDEELARIQNNLEDVEEYDEKWECRDYLNENYNFIEMSSPRNAEERKAYNKRLSKDAEDVYDFKVRMGRIDLTKTKKEAIKEIKDYLEGVRADNEKDNFYDSFSDPNRYDYDSEELTEEDIQLIKEYEKNKAKRRDE